MVEDNSRIDLNWCWILFRKELDRNWDWSHFTAYWNYQILLDLQDFRDIYLPK